MLQKVYLNTQETMVYKICVVFLASMKSCLHHFWEIIKKRPRSFDNYDGGLNVHIWDSQKNQRTCSNIYNCILKFWENQTTTNKTNSFFMKTTNSLRFLK
jgi:hypothetical protein